MSKVATKPMILKNVKSSKTTDLAALSSCGLVSRNLGAGDNVALEVVVDVGSVSTVG